MKMRYLMNGDTLKLDAALCTGCGECREVCPHAVFDIRAAKAVIVDRESCMECGACMKNCAAGALTVKTGVGCAAAIIKGMLLGTEPTCGCDGGKQGAGKQGCC
jgi:NAD-dependent dihydropyrimidine dehydrogenase PreA subunit